MEHKPSALMRLKSQIESQLTLVLTCVQDTLKALAFLDPLTTYDIHEPLPIPSSNKTSERTVEEKILAIQERLFSVLFVNLRKTLCESFEEYNASRIQRQTTKLLKTSFSVNPHDRTKYTALIQYHQSRIAFLCDYFGIEKNPVVYLPLPGFKPLDKSWSAYGNSSRRDFRMLPNPKAGSPDEMFSPPLNISSDRHYACVLERLVALGCYVTSRWNPHTFFFCVTHAKYDHLAALCTQHPVRPRGNTGRKQGKEVFKITSQIWVGPQWVETIIREGRFLWPRNEHLAPPQEMKPTVPVLSLMNTSSEPLPFFPDHGTEEEKSFVPPPNRKVKMLTTSLEEAIRRLEEPCKNGGGDTSPSFLTDQRNHISSKSQPSPSASRWMHDEILQQRLTRCDLNRFLTKNEQKQKLLYPDKNLEPALNFHTEFLSGKGEGVTFFDGLSRSRAETSGSGVVQEAHPFPIESQVVRFQHDYFHDEETLQKHIDQRCFQFSTSTPHGLLLDIVVELKGLFDVNPLYAARATHLVLTGDPPSMSEKCFCFVVRGKWIVHESYLRASREAGTWLEEENFELHPRESFAWQIRLHQVLPFQNCHILLWLPLSLQTTTMAWLREGGCGSLYLSPSKCDWSQVTHILFDTPSPLEGTRNVYQTLSLNLERFLPSKHERMRIQVDIHRIPLWYIHSLFFGNNSSASKMDGQFDELQGNEICLAFRGEKLVNFVRLLTIY